jgi:hypothetical protein
MDGSDILLALSPMPVAICLFQAEAAERQIVKWLGETPLPSRNRQMEFGS